MIGKANFECVLRFTLATLRQLIDRRGNRSRLLEMLLERAQRDQQTGFDPNSLESDRLQRRRSELEEQQATIEYRMARERDDSLFAALSRQFKSAREELADVHE